MGKLTGWLKYSIHLKKIILILFILLFVLFVKSYHFGGNGKKCSFFNLLAQLKLFNSILILNLSFAIIKLMFFFINIKVIFPIVIGWMKVLAFVCSTYKSNGPLSDSLYVLFTK